MNFTEHAASLIESAKILLAGNGNGLDASYKLSGQRIEMSTWQSPERAAAEKLQSYDHSFDGLGGNIDWAQFEAGQARIEAFAAESNLHVEF